MHPHPQNNIAALCERLDTIPLATIASLLGIGPQTLKNYRSGNRQAPAYVVIELAQLVRVIEGFHLWIEERKTKAKLAVDSNASPRY